MVNLVSLSYLCAYDVACFNKGDVHEGPLADLEQG